MSRYVVTKLEGYTTPTKSGGRPKGVAYMVLDTLWNHTVVSTYRSEDYSAQGRMWAAMGAQDEAAIRNAAHEREAVSPAKGMGA